MLVAKFDDLRALAPLSVREKQHALDELVPVPAVPIHKEAAASQHAPAVHEQPLDRQAAAEFLSRTFEWGDTGEEFIARFSRPLTISELVFDMSEEAAAWTPRIRDAVSLACNAGLLTMREDGREVYSVTEGVDISTFVKSTRVERCPLDEAKALGFLTTLFEPRNIEQLAPIHGDVFLALFEHGYTITELCADRRLYSNDSEGFRPKVRHFLEALVAQAFECGLLEKRYGAAPGYPELQEAFFTTEEGKNLLNPFPGIGNLAEPGVLTT